MRLLLSLVAAVGVALLLFALMIVLVMPPRVDSEPEQELARVSFVRSVSDTSSDERQRQPRELPDQPEPPEPLPEVTPPPQPVPAQPQVELNVDIPDLPTQIDLAPAPSLDSIAVAASPPAPAPAAPVAAPQAPAPSAPAPAPSGEPTIEQDVIPLVDIPPNYPQRAQSAGIEGKVVLRFTITAEGRVDNLRVVEAEPKGVFDREARRAAERWRFAPRQENGQAVPREASKTLYFRLQERGR